MLLKKNVKRAVAAFFTFTRCFLPVCLQKERDLELAARIGQTLLTKNKELASRGEFLDEQLTLANEKVGKHDTHVLISVQQEMIAGLFVERVGSVFFFLSFLLRVNFNCSQTDDNLAKFCCGGHFFCID